MKEIKLQHYGEGEAVIYAITGQEKSNEITITCMVILKGLELNETNMKIEIGKEKELKVNFNPENATNKDIIWSSADEKIAEVENGKVKGIKQGRVKITAYNEAHNISASCEVEVKEIEVSKVSLDETNVKIGVGQTYILLASIEPANATNKEISWTSSDNNIITVNKGKINAISEGTATITITSKNGKTATCNIDVSSLAPEKPIRYGKEHFNVRTGPRNRLCKIR